MEEVLRGAPQEIGREEIVIEAQVGSGAFAIVSRARCRGTTVAVKQAKTSVFHGLTSEQLKAFLHEVRVLSKLAHPNLVLFMGVCVVPDKELCIVTEYLDEGNLEDRLLGPAELPLYTRMKWALQAGAGLAWLHGSGVLHLDVSSNMCRSNDSHKFSKD
jgi:serine/threonine protein kinase